MKGVYIVYVLRGVSPPEHENFTSGLSIIIDVTSRKASATAK